MTILYIKTHNKTGLKYFGKSQKSFGIFEKYSGSGAYWIKHLRKHGNDVTTRIYGIFDESDLYYREILVKIALDFSETNNIVESKEWANLIPEDGIDGRHIGAKHTKESRQKMRDNTFVSEEQRRKVSEFQKELYREWKAIEAEVEARLKSMASGE